MKHGMVSLARLLPGWQPKEPEPPPRIVAPRPTAPKVIGDPTREPVNKQAALLISRAHHLELPPMPPAEPAKCELEKLREENALLQSRNKNLIAENVALKRRVELLQQRPPPKPVPVVKPTTPPPPPDPRLALLERLSHGA